LNKSLEIEKEYNRVQREIKIRDFLGEVYFVFDGFFTKIDLIGKGRIFM